MKYFWYKPTQTEYEWTKFGYKTTMRTNRLDTHIKSKMLRTVCNKRPPREFVFFLKNSFILLLLIIMPLLVELLEFMYIEINRGSFSFYCSHVAPIKKVAFVSVSQLLCPCECTVPINKRNVCRVCLALCSNQEGLRDIRPVFHFFFILFK